jgi:hypothetical protein
MYDNAGYADEMAAAGLEDTWHKVGEMTNSGAMWHEAYLLYLICIPHVILFLRVRCGDDLDLWF